MTTAANTATWGSWRGVPTHLAQYGLFDGIGHAASKTWTMTKLTVELIAKMLTLRLAPENIAGPLTIAKVAGDSARVGIGTFLSVLAMLSISLGIVNLLPITILDGGVVVLNAIELVRRKPLSAWAEAVGNRVGLALVAGLMLLATYNDIVRWFLPSS